MKKLLLILFILILIFNVGCTKAEDKDNNLKSTEDIDDNIQEETNRYSIENIMVGKGTEYELKGKLTVPSNATADNPCPVVVLVHGSGPQDMDEILYENMPFRDIAEYLSSHGIAVIRYDKRTFTHGLKMTQDLGGSLTVYEETIEDAILATEILKADPRINENKVFIIGHSLGGMLAPRIHVMGGNYAGIISLAGSPRYLIDISKDQNMAAIEEMEDGDKKTNALYEMENIWDDYYNAFLILSDNEAQNTTIPGWGGASAYYFKDLYENPTSKYIKDITVPFLIMQGDKDFQVSIEKDFMLWQELLAGRNNATFKLYNGLNHFFMTSTWKTITEYQEEYKIAGHVNTQVLADITEWIKAN